MRKAEGGGRVIFNVRRGFFGPRLNTIGATDDKPLNELLIT